MSKKSALGIFFRIPLYGKVKKRLAAEIGKDAALKAYRSMLYATIENAFRIQGIDIYGFYEGEVTAVIDFQKKIPLILQKGNNLGEKMCNAVKLLFNKGCEKVSLIGVDSPDLPFAFITDAFEKLDSHDLVIGPSEDGGYYLIGMNKPFDTIFKDINWGYENVLKDTVSKAKASGISYFLLPEWYDIDDLNSFNRWKLKNPV
jgi:hypothetical protein